MRRLSELKPVLLSATFVICTLAACKKASEKPGFEAGSGMYCDRLARVEIKVKKKSLMYVRPGVDPTVLAWHDDANGYFVQLPRRAYKLVYKAPDFELHDCESPKECRFSRVIRRCD